MTAEQPDPVAQQMRAMLDLVETDRARQCTQILDEANGRAAAQRAQAHAEARVRMRQAFAEQRLRRREQIAAAQARLATQRRLHEQQRNATLLRLAWKQLPAELLVRWRAPATRAGWVAQVLEAARVRMPGGGWHVSHPPDWPAAEREAMAGRLVAEAGAPPVFAAAPAIAAGLKIAAAGNVIDGTLEGLLADRADLEARLLRRLEPSP